MAERQQERCDRVRGQYSFEKIIMDALAGTGEYPGRYMQFGRYATPNELAEVLQRLTTETDEKVLLRLLWVFRRAQLPELHSRVWELAESKNDDIRSAAIVALSQTSDPKIGELGRTKLRSPDFSENDHEVLGIIIRNYQPQDETLIMSALARLAPNDDNAHSLGYRILDICEENDSPVFSEIVNWVYETNPCTICRRKAVEWMIDKECISTQIVSECLCDANEDIQRLVQTIKPN